MGESSKKTLLQPSDWWEKYDDKTFWINPSQFLHIQDNDKDFLKLKILRWSCLLKKNVWLIFAERLLGLGGRISEYDRAS